MTDDQTLGGGSIGARDLHVRHRRRLLFAGVVLCLAIPSLILFDVGELVAASNDWARSHELLAPLLFVTAYIVATVLLVPGALLTLGAGTVFGIARGFVLVNIGSTVGATLAFLIGRYLARDWVIAKTRDNPSFAAIDHAIRVDGWKIVSLVRLSPLFPFTFLNYAFGLTAIRLRDYVLASWIAMIPGTFMYAYIGSLARMGAGPEPSTASQWWFHGIGLLATVAVVVVITRRTRKALDRLEG